ALPNVAAAQARGEIGAEHVRIIEKFFDELPTRIDAVTREQAEADLARTARDLGPTQFRAAADRLALVLNQDGELPDEADRARRRYLTIEKQGVDGMSRFHGLLDPEGRATLDAVLAKLAAPGMCNPDDETPCIDREPDADAVQRDARSPRQRNHDALKAGCEIWRCWLGRRRANCPPPPHHLATPAVATFCRRPVQTWQCPRSSGF